MSVQFETKKLTEELQKTGASEGKRGGDTAYKNFLNIKTTGEKEYYRLRLLYFSDTTNKRTIPFIEKMISSLKGEITYYKDYNFPIKHTFDFHDKEAVNYKVTLLRILTKR